MSLCHDYDIDTNPARVGDIEIPNEKFSHTSLAVSKSKPLGRRFVLHSLLHSPDEISHTILRNM